MKNIAEQLRTILPKEKIKSALIDRYAFASDASFYYLLPAVIVQPSLLEEIKGLFLFSQQHAIPLVFRTGGTSLSGQSITDGILVDLSRYWRNSSVEKNGARVRVQPGVIAAMVNRQLKKYGKKLGPDPASINAAMMGGIISNNSSGMCCGVHYNTYHTLLAIKFILPNGKVYNTEIAEDYKKFETESAELHEKLLWLKSSIAANKILAEKIKSKYQIKNTVGYSLNAFLDFEHPLDIMAHLLIGAEGTLGFIAEAVMATIPDYPAKKTGLLFFENPILACKSIPALITTGAAALELMDRAALRSVELQAGAPEILQQLPEQATAILCEYQAETLEMANAQYEKAKVVIERLPLLATPAFSDSEKEQQAYWKLRKGMYPSVAAAREKGHTVMLEDIALPVNKLGEGVMDIQALMQAYGYGKGIIFGHAKEGNLHFVITQSMNDAEGMTRFQKFSAALAQLVIHKYNGSLKGEHGTGRQVAPFVKEEWGEDAYQIMKALKIAVDPHGTLNPDVLLSEDDTCHLKHLKSLPIVEEEVDTCIECGYCENRCPSRDFTLTPRQRIGIRRALQRLNGMDNKAEKKELLQQYQYAGLDTCAVDGMCALDCPVAINTGDLVKRLRRENHAALANKMALLIAKKFRHVEALVKVGIKTGVRINRIFGANTMHLLTVNTKKIIPSFPLWMKELKGIVALSVTKPETHKSILYLPTCITRMMGGGERYEKTIVETIISVSKKAGISIVIPDKITGTCCGQAFSSKGFAGAHAYKVNETVEKIWHWSNEGTMPVLLDITSCTQSLLTCRSSLTAINKERFDKIKIIDSIDFIADYLLPNTNISQKKNNIVLHPVCSIYKMNLQKKLETIAAALSTRYHIPLAAGCCGMAGDRGFYYPGLIAAATANEANEVKEQQYDGYYSSGKTCEMSLSNATGKNYQSLFYLLDEVSE
jgi:D-lactate dehydrogenase